MMDIKDCEQAKAGDCCYCKNMAYYKLEETLANLNRELVNLVEPYISDCTGINENGEFDIVLCIKELLEERYNEYSTNKTEPTNTFFPVSSEEETE